MQQLLNIDYRAEIVELRGLGTFKVVLLPPGALYIFSADDKNRLDTTTWTNRGQVVNTNDVTSFDVAALDGDHLVVMYTTAYGNSMVAVWPGDQELYGPKDPYRLYYGLDSKTLYMNVENRWAPVAYLNHDMLDNTGTITHEQIEERLAALERSSRVNGGQGAPTKVTWPSARPKRNQEYEFIESTFTIEYDIFLHHIGVPAYDTYDGCTLQIHSEIAGTTKEYVLEGNSFNINERQLFGDTLTIRILNNPNGIPYAEAAPICGAGMTYVKSVFGELGEYSAWSVGIVIHYS